LRGIQGKSQMLQMLDRLRQSPPRELAGLAVTHWEDLRDEDGRLGPLKGATDAAARNVLIFHCGPTRDGAPLPLEGRVVLRPSGTEPKAKIYVEVCSPPCPPGTTPETWQQ